MEPHQRKADHPAGIAGGLLELMRLRRLYSVEVAMGEDQASLRVIEKYLRREFPRLQIEPSRVDQTRAGLFNLGDYQLEVTYQFLRSHGKHPKALMQKLKVLMLADEIRNAGEFPNYLELGLDGPCAKKRKV